MSVQPDSPIPSRAAPDSRRERWRRLALRAGVGVGAVLILYGVVAGLVLPGVVRRQAEKRLTALAGAPVTIGRVGFQPFALRLSVGDLRWAEPDGALMLSWSNLVADVQLASVWRGELLLREVRVDRMQLEVRRNRDGRINLLDLRDRMQAAAPAADTNRVSSGLFPFSLTLLAFTNGAVGFRDEALPQPFVARLDPMDFTLAGLTTRTGGVGVLSFTAAGDAGERLAWEGRVGLNPLAAEGTIRGESIAVTRPSAYVDRVSPLRPTQGVLSFSIPYRVGVGGEGLDVRVADARLAVTNIALVERETTAPFAEASGMALGGLDVVLSERSARLGTLVLEGAALHVRRMKADGEAAGKATGKAAGKKETTTNLRGVLHPEVVEAMVGQLTDWRLGLVDAAVRDAAVDWEDTALETPTRLSLGAIEVALKGLTNESNAPPLEVSVGARWGDAGVVRVVGGGTLIPARGTGTVALEKMSLAPLNPYVAEYLRLALNRGDLSVALEARYGTGEPGAPLLHIGGRMAVEDFAATETSGGTDFIRWGAVELNGIGVALEPNRLELEELAVRQLQTSLMFMTNGQLNVLQLIRETRELGEESAGAGAGAPAAATPAPESAAAAPTPVAPGEGEPPFWEAWPMRLGKLHLEQVTLFAADEFYGGGFRTSIESLDGEVRGVALPSTDPAQIDLKGRLSATSGFSLAGTMNADPSRFAVDLQLATTRADLKQFTPYTVRFAGYPVVRGELTANVHYRVEGDALEAENKLSIDGFTLGEKTESPDAVDLPLKLGVALLKDNEGKIHLDLPLTGTLSDPQFSLAPLVWQVVRNVIVKAVTAPFKLLGSLFGGGEDEELEFVEFQPGTLDPVGNQTNRVKTLAKALQGRPALHLALLPGFDPAVDRMALATNRLEVVLRKLRVEEIAAAGGGIPDADRVSLSPEDRARLVEVAYSREFGGTPPAAAAPDPAAPADPGAAPAGTGAAVLSWEQKMARLVETTVIEPSELGELAQRRAEAAQAWLLAADSAIAPERVRIVPHAPDQEEMRQARVTFQLE